MLRLNHSANGQHLLRERNIARGGSTLELCVGDRIYLTEPGGLDASWAASSNSFDWGSVSVSDISWSINNVSLANIELDASGGAGSVVLSGTIANLTAPTLFGETSLLVEPFGWGVVAQGKVSVVPVISSISHRFGSMAGGTQITITGTGFSSAFLEEVIIGGEACTDVEVDDSDGKTMWCVTAPSLVEGWGDVNATFNNVHAVCDVNRTAYNDTTYQRLHLQVYVQQHPGRGVDDAREASHKHPDTVTLTGEKFAPNGNIVTLGFQHCPVTKENSSYIECTVPRHVGGTYKVTVENPTMGLAEGLLHVVPLPQRSHRGDTQHEEASTPGRRSPSQATGLRQK